MKQCPHCHQQMPEWRAGVKLSSLKARIFDVIKRADYEGVSLETINSICFDGCSSAVNIRNHIRQINDVLVETDLKITGKASGMVGFFHIVTAPQGRKLLGRQP